MDTTSHDEPSPGPVADVGEVSTDVSMEWFKRYCFPHYEFIVIQLAWFMYCGSAPWANNKYLRIATLLEGIVKAGLDFWVTIKHIGEDDDPPVHVYTVSMFMTYVLGRVKLSTEIRTTNMRQPVWILDMMARVAVALWLVLDMLTPV